MLQDECGCILTAVCALSMIVCIRAGVLLLFACMYDSVYDGQLLRNLSECANYSEILNGTRDVSKC
jgi:hypothetical protein